MTNDDRLSEIVERYDYADTEWSPIVEEADTDMRCVAGDPWDPADRKQREDANRPCLALDEIGQYENQVINTLLANPRAMKFAPTGNGANDKGAEFYANKARETEYRSHAQLAYTTAFQSCVERSYGWVRLTTKHESDSSFNQDIWIEDIPNPNMVLPDPESKRPDSSDLRFLFYREQLPIAEFKRKWPKAAIKDFMPDVRKRAPSWFGDKEQITVAEYWAKEIAKTRRLLLLKVGTQAPVEVFEDALPKDFQLTDDTVLRERKVDQYKVTQYITNGVEILETNAWKGKYIPFASCFGKVIYVEGKRIILSMTRLARDPYMLYCYYRTCEAELVGMTPKFPYFAYEGQLSPAELINLQKSLHEPVAVIQVKPTIEGLPSPQVLAFPARQPYEPPIQGLEVGAEAARRSIQAAIMGSPLPTDAQRQNQKSGVALQQIEKSGQIGSFHFQQHYDDMIRQVAVIWEDLADKILDAARNTGTRDAEGNAKTVRINDPKPTPEQFSDPQQFQAALQAWQGRLPEGADETVSTKGDYLVTVSSGPAADSQRDAVADFIGKLASIPEVMAKAADLIVRLQGQTMNLGPLIDQLAERLTPPEFKKPKEGEGPDPQQLQQELQQAKQQGQMHMQMIQKLTQEITTKQVENASKEKIAEQDNKTKLAIADLESQRRAETAIAVAEISSKAKDAALFYEERARIGVQTSDANAQMHDQAHDVALAAQEHQHELEAAQQAHDQALEQGDQAHQQALEQGDQGVAGQMAVQQQSADLAPPAAGA